MKKLQIDPLEILTKISVPLDLSAVWAENFKKEARHPRHCEFQGRLGTEAERNKMAGRRDGADSAIPVSGKNVGKLSLFENEQIPQISRLQ